MAVTISDVARAAAVSPGTVSNVLNRPELVKAATRQRVEQAMRELAYVPNRQARLLAGGRDTALGFVVHDAGNPFFAEMVHSTIDAAEAHGFSVVLASSMTSTQRQEAALRLFRSYRLSGILLAPTVEDPYASAEALPGDTPVVLVDYPARDGGCSVQGDDLLGGRLAADHLIERGARRFAYVGGPRRVRQHRDRLRGFRARLREAGLDPTQSLLTVTTASDTMAAGEQAGRSLAPRASAVDAVFCGNDLLAIGVMKGLSAHGITVPSSLLVVGYDDIDLAAMIALPLTTIRQPIREMGTAATELLLEEISGGPHDHQRKVFEPTLVVRESTGVTTRRPRRRPAPAAT